jgi:hypothetical protein
MKGFGNIGRKKRQPVTRGIKNCRDSRLFKVCSPLQLLCTLIGNRPQSATFHTANVTHKHEKMNSENNTKLDTLSIVILIIAGFFIIISFFAPFVLTLDSINDVAFDNNTGFIGDTIGGLMNPFIAISGVLLTFLAFFIQFKANRLQQRMFRDELDEQKNQFQKSQFENQFYEMLRLHKENVNEFELKLIIYTEYKSESIKNEEIVKGRRVFKYLIKEFELCYHATKQCFPQNPIKTRINQAYGVFFHGLNEVKNLNRELFKTLGGVQVNHESDNFRYLNTNVKKTLGIEWQDELHYPLFNGYSYQLAHYYRHLFQTVKFIVNQKENLLTYEEKRKYLRILRAQLSNQEQVMLFYNWFSDFGRQWENVENKFFTDYRMIHNIYQSIILSDIQIEELFEPKGNYMKEKNREFDSLFEFEDWNR